MMMASHVARETVETEIETTITVGTIVEIPETEVETRMIGGAVMTMGIATGIIEIGITEDVTGITGIRRGDRTGITGTRVRTETGRPTRTEKMVTIHICGINLLEDPELFTVLGRVPARF